MIIGARCTEVPCQARLRVVAEPAEVIRLDVAVDDHFDVVLDHGTVRADNVVLAIGLRYFAEIPHELKIRGRESRSAEVDQAGCVPNSCPIFMSFGCEKSAGLHPPGRDGLLRG
jgi:hypothetical protein